jgi:GTP-binding protein HflX
LKYAESGDTLHTLFISAANRENIDALRDVMYEEVKKIHSVRYPYNNFLF